MGTPGRASKTVGPWQFRDVIGHFASGVTVITAESASAVYGMTVSSLCSVSLEPPTLLACVDRQSSTVDAIAQSGSFSINILRDEQGDLAQRFAATPVAKLEEAEIVRSPRRHPLVAKALAYLDCVVVNAVPVSTHTVLVAEVLHVGADGGAPLAYYRGRFRSLLPAGPES
jgi:flavin reductase (DIM6/NTAB) family NADH-FMN oxidoreductase RutF